MSKAEHMYRKGLKDPKLSPLAYLQAPHKQVVKGKARL